MQAEGLTACASLRRLRLSTKGNTKMYTEPEFTRLQNEIEALLDRHPIDELVAALAEVCDHKADHVMSNWQDKHLAKLWQRNAIALNQVQAKLQATF
jgi:hypothetical protein